MLGRTMRRGRGNLRVPPVDAVDREVSAVFVEGAGARVEHIVSHGQASPTGFWYDQDEDEFVLVLEGAAELEVEGEGIVRLGVGDWLDLPAHLRHRVAWTHPDRHTVWLAVFRPAARDDHDDDHGDDGGRGAR